MAKLFRAAVLFAAIGAVMYAGGLVTDAPAQDKKDKKDTKATKETVGVIEVYTDKKGEWRFRVKVEDKSIAIGTVGHEKQEDALKVVETLKATMAKGKVEIIKDKKRSG